MELLELEDVSYGPKEWSVEANSVRDFVVLTGDDESGWDDHAPPGFSAAALFAVAPELLDTLSDRSVIHGEQTFDWHRPIEVDGVYQVIGRVARVRERGTVSFVSFEMMARDGEEVVLDGKSLFLVTSGDVSTAGTTSERSEPPAASRGDVGDAQVSASRADLVRYASATRDWNPVHWDHDSAVKAGFPGVVVHGLLQAGWATRIAGGSRPPFPLASARFRFRNPMLPGRPATISAARSGTSVEVTIADEENTLLTAAMVLTDE